MPTLQPKLKRHVVLAFATVATVAALAAHPGPASALTAPTLPPGQPAPATAPYDTTANARQQVDAAMNEARRTHRIVLLDFGANWCPDCRMLAGVLHAPNVKPWLDDHFILVPIDVGRIDRNLDLAQAHGVHVTEIPTVLELTPDGALLDPDGAHALGNARTMSAQSDIDLIADWASRTPPAH